MKLLTHFLMNEQYIKKYGFLLYGLFLCISIHAHIQESHIVVVTCSYNNSRFYKWNLDSILMQQYHNYHVIYIDDCSIDDTYELVKAYVKKYKKGAIVKIIRNDTRRLALANLYTAIWSCNDRDIIVILDGDDRFAHNNVLAYINCVYNDPNVWLTYGQFREYPSGILGFNVPMPAKAIKNNLFRSFWPQPTHLRTFYAGLFKHIKKEDLIYDGDFFPMSYDLAIMFPMIEMARDGHFKFIPDVLMDYNTQNQISDHRVNRELQCTCDRIIRCRQPYDIIKSPFGKNVEVELPKVALSRERVSKGALYRWFQKRSST